jgi:predicted RNase H-like nuclease (RuvC/YqgF family)
LRQASDRAEIDRQLALDRLAQADSDNNALRRQSHEELLAQQLQFEQDTRMLRDELNRIRSDMAELRSERELMLGTIDTLRQEQKRLEEDASEVVLARKTQQRAVVKIARLTRSLQRTWKQVEIMRKRNQELARRIVASHVAEAPECQSTAVPPVGTFTPLL